MPDVLTVVLVGENCIENCGSCFQSMQGIEHRDDAHEAMKVGVSACLEGLYEQSLSLKE